MTAAARLGVGVIGAGRVGPVLALALAGAGHALTGITKGSDEERITGMLPGIPQLEALDVVRRSQLVVLAVPHEELPSLVAGIADANGWEMGQLVVHTDPLHGVEVLRPAAERGAIPLAIHPAITFTGTSIDLRQLSAAYAAVTAPPAVLPIAQALAVEIGCEPVVVAEEDRAAYGEAVGTVTAFSRSIVQQSTGILRGIGFDNPGGYLSALVRSTVDKALVEPGDHGPLDLS